MITLRSNKNSHKRHAVSQRVASVCFLLVSAITVFSEESLAQVWKAGRSQLMSGKYPAAEASLTQAYKSSKTPQDRAESLKYLGVAQYMQKKEPQASATFKAALKLNPKLKLQDSDVADESVIPFFDRQRGAAGQTASASAPKSNGIPGRPPGGTAKGSGTAPVTKKAKKTLVRVNSNVQGAQISIDGIAYGTTGSDLEIKPGEVILEITSPGYIKKSVKINVAPLTSNTLTVNLEKPQPKAKPKAVADESNGSGGGAIPLPATRPGKGKKASVAKQKNNDLFSGDSGGPVDDFGGSPALAPPSAASQAQQIAPPPPPQQPMLPPGAYGQPVYQQPMYQQPMYQQPMYQQPMYQQPIYQQPIYQQPQYQQPQYPPPQYGPPSPPSVYNPYGGGSAYQQPGPPIAPAYDPLASAPPVEPSAPSAALPPATTTAPLGDDGMPPPPKAPSVSKKKVADSKKGGGCSTFIKLLPFGAGQFCQGSTFKGVLFAGAQLGGLYYYKSNTDAARELKSKLETTLDQREADSPSGKDPEFDQKTQDIKTSGNATIEKAQQNANLSLACFGGAWALGVVDTFVFPPAAKTKKSIKKARLSLQLEQDYQQTQKPTLAFLSPLSLDVGQDAIWYAGFAIPVSPQDRGAMKLGVAWDL